MKPVVVNLGPDIEEAQILWLADIHRGHENFNQAAWDRLRSWVMEEENRYVMLGGDLMESATKGSKGDPYLSNFPQQELEILYEELKPLRDRIWCMIGGNHEERIWRESGIDPLAFLAMNLEIPYSRGGTFVIARLGKAPGESQRKRWKPVVYTLYLTHGWSGGRRVGSKSNALEDLSLGVYADVYLLGHTHIPIGFKQDRVGVDLRNQTMYSKTVTFVNAGSLQKWGGYAQRKGYTPGTNDMPVVLLSGRRHDVRVVI